MPQPRVRRALSQEPSGHHFPLHGKAPPWETAVQIYLRERLSDNLSAATLDHYRWILTNKRTDVWRDDHHIKVVSDLTADKLRALQAELLEVGCKPHTVGHFNRVIRQFTKYCSERWDVEVNLSSVSAPRIPDTAPVAVSTVELDVLLKACRHERDRMLLIFMARSGLRLQEVCNVKVDDLLDSPHGAYVQVRSGKGGKDRIVPLDSPHFQLSKLLQRYLRSVRPQDTHSRHLWLTTRKERGDYVPLRPHSIQTLLKRLSQQTGIHVSAHMFRRHFATESIRHGVDPYRLQLALGHTTPDMTFRYLRFHPDDILGAWSKRSD